MCKQQEFTERSRATYLAKYCKVFVDREEKTSRHDLNGEMIIFCILRDACGLNFASFRKFLSLRCGTRSWMDHCICEIEKVQHKDKMGGNWGEEGFA